MLLLRALGRPATVSLYLFLAAAALVVVRAVSLFFKQTRPVDAERPSPCAAIVRNASVALGYWVLIALVTGDDHVWIVYTLIGVTAAMAFAAFMLVGRKGTLPGEHRTH